MKFIINLLAIITLVSLFFFAVLFPFAHIAVWLGGSGLIGALLTALAGIAFPNSNNTHS